MKILTELMPLRLSCLACVRDVALFKEQYKNWTGDYESILCPDCGTCLDCLTTGRGLPFDQDVKHMCERCAQAATSDQEYEQEMETEAVALAAIDWPEEM